MLDSCSHDGGGCFECSRHPSASTHTGYATKGMHVETLHPFYLQHILHNYMLQMLYTDVNIMISAIQCREPGIYSCVLFTD